MDILQKFNPIFPDNNTNNYKYSPIKGIYPSNINMITEHIRTVSKIYFNLIDKHKLEYAVFAGQSVGLCRNGKNLPWVDDYDMIIFKKDVVFFETIIVPELKNMGFVCFPYFSSGYQVLSQYVKDAIDINHKFFHVDIFYFDFHQNLLFNNGNWGEYNGKIHRKYVLPFARRKIDDLYLPFFRNPEAEVKIYFGNIYDKCIVSTHAHDNKIEYNNWKKCYADFEIIRVLSLENTKNIIYANKDYSPENTLNLQNHDFGDEIDILKYINMNNVNHVCVFNEKHIILFSASIKYFFPKVTISFTTQLYLTNILLYLSYIDKLYVESHDVFDKYKEKSFMFPETDIILNL